MKYMRKDNIREYNIEMSYFVSKLKALKLEIFREFAGAFDFDISVVIV